MSTKANGLLDANGILKAIFPDKASRPSIRWLREQQARRSIPFVKWGHLVFFDPEKVREALENRLTVKARGV